MLSTLRNLVGVDQSYFCWIDWHADTRQTHVHYGDSPKPSGALHRNEFHRYDESGVTDFISQLKTKGWQEYMYLPNHDGWERFLMRAELPDKNYEYCVVSSSVIVHKFETAIPQREGAYHLGNPNETLLTGEAWGLSYTDTLHFLERQGWQFMEEKEYPLYGPKSKRLLQLRYYKRPLRA